MKNIFIVSLFIFIVIASVPSAIFSGWAPQSSGTANDLHSIFFINNNTGFACGNSGTILKTSNGGVVWITVSAPVTDNLYSCYFLNENTGWAVGNQSKILRTTNAGTSWDIDISPISKTRLIAVQF